MTPNELASRTAAWLKLPGGSDEALNEVAAAVHTLVNALDHVTPGTWDNPTTLGATMLTARMYRRRNSPNGIESLTELGTSYVSRYDSDIARLLRIDAYAKPVAI